MPGGMRPDVRSAVLARDELLDGMVAVGWAAPCGRAWPSGYFRCEHALEFRTQTRRVAHDRALHRDLQPGAAIVQPTASATEEHLRSDASRAARAIDPFAAYRNVIGWERAFGRHR